MILLVSMAGFWLGSAGSVDGEALVFAMVGITLLAAGIFTLNQYMEHDLDGLMRRTENRPLPTGRVQPGEAFWFGWALTVVAQLWLTVFVNPLSGLLALFTLASYLFLYTPLKRKTPHSTLVGAFPGAVPPLLGWVAATGEMSAGAWVVFAILFLWQFPHFHAIAWLYREDYGRAGIRVWPVVAPDNPTMSREIVGYEKLLLPVGVLPWALGLAGAVYLAGAVVLGVVFLCFSIHMARAKSGARAKRLLLASVVYLPVLFLLMVFDN